MISKVLWCLVGVLLAVLFPQYVQADVIDSADKALDGAMASAAIIGVVVEFVLRLVPSKKPLSIAYAVVGVVKMAAKTGAKLVALLEKAAGLLDKVLPQKIAVEKKAE